MGAEGGKDSSKIAVNHFCKNTLQKYFGNWLYIGACAAKHAVELRCLRVLFDSLMTRRNYLVKQSDFAPIKAEIPRLVASSRLTQGNPKVP